MYKMTTHERFTRMFDHKEADRVAMWDFPWPGALRRWHAEGMPENVSYEDYFDVDKVERVVCDNSPRLKEYVVEENDRCITTMTNWGGTQKDFKHDDSTPDFVDYTIKTEEIWKEIKPLIVPTEDRVPWKHLQDNFANWRKEGSWILGDLWFSFNQLTSFAVGTERFLIAMLEEPEWCADMLNTCLDVNLALLDKAWEKGYTFDMLNVRDDLAYKGTQFFSIDVYNELIRPVHKKCVDWAHNKGIKVRLHSCGYVQPFVKEFVSLGFDCLHPLERKAGMDPLLIKKEFGDKLVIHGGINAMLWKDIDAVKAEMTKFIPTLKESGGYIFAADHSIPNDVTFENIKEIIALAKKLGSY
jgi:uroporphyrinogen decarboxylase